MRLLRLLCAGGLLCTAGPGLAQSPGDRAPEADRNAITSCLRESAGTPRSCIGAVAVACLREGGGDRRDAEIACSRREARVWRERLDAGAGALAQRLDSGARSRLEAVQRSWEAYAAQKCSFEGALQTAARASATHAGCDLREVAERSLELERMARRLTQAPPSRPEIFR